MQPLAAYAEVTAQVKRLRPDYAVARKWGIIRDMEWNWAQLGMALKAGRTAMRPRVTQLKMAERVGVSLATVQAIEAGKEFEKITPTIRAYAREIGWTEDSPQKVLEGGEPAEQPEPDAAPAVEGGRAPAAGLTALPLLVQQALTRDGEVIDATVMDVELPGVNGEMIIVVKGKPVAPTETMTRELIEIAERYLKLRGIAPPDGNGESKAAEA